MGKYNRLLEHLCRADDGPIEMTFEEIDGLVGGLPPIGGEVARVVGK